MSVHFLGPFLAPTFVSVSIQSGDRNLTTYFNIKNIILKIVGEISETLKDKKRTQNIIEVAIAEGATTSRPEETKGRNWDYWN